MEPNYWYIVSLIVTWIVLIAGACIAWGKAQERLKANDKQTERNAIEIEELKRKVSDSVKFEQLEMMFSKFGDEIKNGFKAIMQDWELRLVNTGRLDPENRRKP